MKMLKTIPVLILLFAGYLCNAQSDTTWDFSPSKGGTEEYTWDTTTPGTFPPSTPSETPENDHFPGRSQPTLVGRSQPTLVAGRSLPTLVVAGVSIALVLLCILIVAIFWYAWKKSQEGSMVLNPIPYGAEAAVSLQNPSVPESQQGWPSERAVP